MQGAVSAPEPSFAAQRRALVDGQIRTFDVTDRAVIEAFLDVPREDFLPADLRALAYSDAALTLKTQNGSSGVRGLLQPMHLARLLQGAELLPSHRALVVAGEIGYAAALLSRLVASVVTLESDAGLAAQGSGPSAAARVGTIEVVSGPLPEGHAAKAPYDVILIQGAVETGLDLLFQQLAPGGRLVTIEPRPSGTSPGPGRAVRFDRQAGEVSRRVLFDATALVLSAFRRAPSFAF